jgi:hypothetical protein
MSKTDIAVAVGMLVVGTALVTAANRQLGAEFGTVSVMLASWLLFATSHRANPELF